MKYINIRTGQCFEIPQDRRPKEWIQNYYPELLDDPTIIEDLREFTRLSPDQWYQTCNSLFIRFIDLRDQFKKLQERLHDSALEAREEHDS